MSRNVLLLAAALLLSFSFCQKGDSPVLVEIENDQAITLQDFKNAYAGMLDQLKQTGMSDEKIAEIKGLSQAEAATLPGQLRILWQQLQPQGVFENIKQTKLIYRYAKENGFLDKAEVKARAQLFMESYIAQIYMADSIKLPKFKDEELEAECNRIRASAPENPQIQAMTASQCMDQAKASLGMQARQYEMANYMQTIKDRYRLKENQANVNKYIKSGGDSEDEAKQETKKESE